MTTELTSLRQQLSNVLKSDTFVVLFKLPLAIATVIFRVWPTLVLREADANNVVTLVNALRLLNHRNLGRRNTPNMFKDTFEEVSLRSAEI